MENIRAPAVAGLFYPDNPERLQGMITQELALASPPSDISAPKALIVPHAGYIYSGSVAASAYVLLQSHRHLIKHVVIIGPSHRVGFNGLALSNADYFTTPLGQIPVDKDKQATLMGIEGVNMNEQAHFAEHSLEVQLPFLQNLLDDFTIVPIVTGNASPQLVSAVIETLWGGPETLILISSDLSHFHNYQTAQQLDQATSKAILNLNIAAIDPKHACGCIAIRGLLYYSQQYKLSASILDMRNSGDTSDNKDRVVGYGSYLFTG